MSGYKKGLEEIRKINLVRITIESLTCILKLMLDISDFWK